jgi:hypothetical protein
MALHVVLRARKGRPTRRPRRRVASAPRL